MADLSRKRERERLPARREPHWQRLSAGAYLGFRRGPDTWIARFRDRGGQQHYHALGERLEFDEAKRQADAWLIQMEGATVRTVTRGKVRAALEGYLDDLKRHGRPGAAKDALWRFRATVWDDPIADLIFENATREDFLEWRDRLKPGRAPRTVNRLVRAVVAALNWAVGAGYVANPAAWRLKALADDVEDEGATAVFLTAKHRKALIAAARPPAGQFLRGLEITGARPIELAAATVGDFDGRALCLKHRKGRPARLKSRQVVLAPEGVSFLEEMTKDRAAAAPLFTEDGTQPWRRHVWARDVRDAIAVHNKKAKGAARIPAGASAYSFRHARISELLQLHGVDPLTVAQQTGTSVAMIEKAYLKFIPSALLEKLRAISGS